MNDLLTTAIAMHQAGQMNSAAQLYEQVLGRESDNADALHMLGVLRHQQGDHARGVELIGKAVVLRPNMPAYHANLAEVYRVLGQWERAAGCCHTALRLQANYPEARCNLGLALQGMGRKDEAVAEFRRALELRPDFASVHNNLGIVLRELDQTEEALSHFRRAVELAANFVQARTNLGQMLVDCGKPEEALPHCREAVRLQPNLAAVHHNLGNALLALERFVEARAAYLEAIRLEPNLAPAHANLGLVLQHEGQINDALVWLKQAVELAPANADYWRFLAELHSEREDPAAALSCWERAVALAPEQAIGHNGLGWALQEDGRLAEAGEHFRIALNLQPDLPMTHVRLGGLHEELGEMAEAEAAFRSARDLQPDFALPLARLGTLLCDKLGADDQRALEERLLDASLDKMPRTRLLFALAHVLDARGDYGRAADCLRQANALALEMSRPNRVYDPVAHERFVNDLVAAFDSDIVQRLAGAGLPTQRPVFVFGLPRSGTTLIEQILASHPLVHGAGELRIARQTFETIPAVVGCPESPIDGIPHLDREAVEQLARQHLADLDRLDGGPAGRIVDKMPDNYMYLGFLAVLFPNATFIHCRRDMRDVALSCWMTDFRSIRWANAPEHLALRFQQYGRLMDHWRSVSPVPLHEVAYEDVVSDLEGTARRLLAACGLDWRPACLEFHRTRRPVRTASVTQVRKPLYARSVGRWKHYQHHAAELFQALAK